MLRKSQPTHHSFVIRELAMSNIALDYYSSYAGGFKIMRCFPDGRFDFYHAQAMTGGAIFGEWEGSLSFIMAHDAQHEARRLRDVLKYQCDPEVYDMFLSRCEQTRTLERIIAAHINMLSDQPKTNTPPIDDVRHMEL